MQRQVSLPKKILITAAVMFALILFVYHFKIPNPNMILIAGLILTSALFGFGGGIIAAAIMLGYALFFFSTDHSFTRFTFENLQKVGVSLVGIIIDMFLVCFLKQTEVQAFEKVDALTKKLKDENKKLQQMSLTDALTGIRNRMALRHDCELYQGHEISIMMLDLNDFKMINDTGGHEKGDSILIETGQFLSETFGENHCYRYGGDEFLVIVPDMSEADFNEKLNSISWFSGFSVGYVHDVLKDHDMLQALISQADAKMYEAKRAYQTTKKLGAEKISNS